MKTTLVAALLAAALMPVQMQALENEDLLALVAMPLAVAAVSEVTDVPMSELIDVVTLMNDALVPPAQFIEVVRYAPAALVMEIEAQPRFNDFVRVQFDSGLRGTALVNSIEDHYQVYGITGVDLDVTAPRIVDVDDRFIPEVVTTRIAETRRAHPHGGPPGQLKKQRGLQTGAEIVHGSKPGKKKQDDDAVVNRVVDKQPVNVVRDEKVKKQDRKPETKEARGSDDHGSKGKGHGNGNGKGKGKGKG